jgi:hypothetical protein
MSKQIIINSIFNNQLAKLFFIIATKNLLFNEPLHLLLPSSLSSSTFGSASASVSSRPRRTAFIVASQKITEQIDYMKDEDLENELVIDNDSAENKYDPEYKEKLSPVSLGEDVEKIIAAYCPCPICGSKLYKFVKKNIPIADLICSNISYHIFINKSFLFQVKTSNGSRVLGKPYFDKSFVKISSILYKPLYCIDHLNPNFNVLIPNLICLNIYIHSTSQTYVINLPKSFFYFPSFSDPIKPYIIHDSGLTLNPKFIFSIPTDFRNLILLNLHKSISDNVIPKFISINLHNSFNKSFIDKLIKLLLSNPSSLLNINSFINNYFKHLCPLITSQIIIPISVNQDKRPHLTPKTLTPDSRLSKKSKSSSFSDSDIHSDPISQKLFFHKYLKYKLKYLSLKNIS